MLCREVSPAAFPYDVPLNNHFAPGTGENRRASTCYTWMHRDGKLRVPCAGRYWLHAFAGPGTAYWNTRTLPDGRYRLRITASDPKGHATTRGIEVRIDNA